MGPVKPGVLRDVHGIAVPTFENKTLLPRVEVLVTDSVIKQLQQDGTYRIADEGNADAVLKAEISEISRTPRDRCAETSLPRRSLTSPCM